MKRHLTFILMGTMGAALIAPPLVHAATTKPAVSQSDKDGAEAVHKAVIALTKQYQAFEADPNATIETDSNYFKKNPSSDVTQPMIVKALGVNYGNDIPTDAYVKWQLLSAVPGKFSGDVSAQAVAIYTRLVGGTLLNHPGLDHHTLDGVLSHLSSSTPDSKISQIDDQLNAAAVKAMKANASIVEYRDRLFATLPATQDVCSAGLQDIASRINHGFDAQAIGTLFMTVKAVIIEWSTDAKPAQLQAMSSALMKFPNITKNPAAVPYAKITKDAKGFHWEYAPVLAPTYYTDLAASLQKNVANPPGQLGFKKDDK